MKWRIPALLILGLLPWVAGAFVSTSTNFFIRGSLFSFSSSSTLPYSTSTNFNLISAGGEAAVGLGTTTAFTVRSGALNGLKTKTQPVYAQTHYHWRNDDGSETTATSKTSGTQDTGITNLSKLTGVRVRVEVSNEGGTYYSYSTQQFRLEYGVLSTTCSAIASWTQVGTGAWAMNNSANLTDGNNTTNIASSVGGVSDSNATFITANAGVKDTSSDTAALSVPSDSFAELEYSIAAQSGATDGATYCFRLTNAGSASLFRYDSYPQATLAAGSLTFTTDSGTEAFPNLTPGAFVSTSTILNVTTSNASGFNITIVRNNAPATLALNSDSAVTVSDKTAWSAPAATTSGGNGSASTTQPQTLQFRVRSAGTDVPNYASVWWGVNDIASALFAGIPSSAQTIINRSTAAGSGTVAKVQYNLDVAATQKNGAYSGTITYTATANP